MLFIYKPQCPAQKNFFAQKHLDCLAAVTEDLHGMGHVNIFLLRHNRLRKIGERVL